MSKFNETKTIKTENICGNAAYPMTPKDRLVCSCLTSMFGEPKFYGNNDSLIVTDAVYMAKHDPDFLAKLCVYARNEGNMRSVSHVLACVIAKYAHEYTRRVIRKIIVRADDITEILACYIAMYGKPIPNALKRELGEQVKKFNAYGIAKYSGGKKAVKFKDVLRICHPKPDTDEQRELFGCIINDTLPIPYTWETELSEKGNTKEVWDALIASNKLGYMAMLRNLRNMHRAGVDIKPVLDMLAEPEAAKNSRQLPFRYFSAYRELHNMEGIDGYLLDYAAQKLNAALTVNVDTLPTLKGRTLIAVDMSGSMSATVSDKSKVTCCDIARLLGALAAHICEDADVCYFSAGWNWYRYDTYGMDGAYCVRRYGKSDNILESALAKLPVYSGGTDMHIPMQYALNMDRGLKPYDRVIYFSDNECNSSWDGLNKTVQSEIDKYRNEKNPDLWVHGVDLQGYGTQQFIGKRFNLIAGWGDTVLQFIDLAEKGIDTLTKHIEGVEV